MKFTLEARIFLLSVSLLDGLAGLRLVKVSIPAFKFRGESAMLECQYELNRTGGPPYYGGVGSNSGSEVIVSGAGNRHRSYARTRTRTSTRNRYGGNMHFFDAHHFVATRPKFRRHKRQYSYQTERLQMHQQQQEHQQQQQQQQEHYPSYPYQPSQSYSSSSSTSSGSSDMNGAGSYYQQQQQQQQKEEDEQQHYPYQTQRSPYGHSVYRGAAFSQALGIPGFSNSGVSSSSSSSAAHVGASTFTSGARGATAEGSSTRYKFANGIDDDEEEDDEEEEDDDVAEDDEDEDGEALYAIKWYKDNEEFYRFVPKARPQKTSYRFDGIRVSEEHSDSWRVFLRGLTLNSSGLYRCEISAEAPNFSSVQGEGRMDIVFLPRDGPHIRGQHNQYQIGDTLALNCTSGKSHPASRLQWLINDQPVVDDGYLIAYNDTVHKHGLITSMLGLELTVDGRHFQDGEMRVKCLASISPVLWSGDKESVLQRRRGIIDNREAMLLVRGAAARLHPLGNFLCSLRLLTAVAILTITCQLLLSTEQA